MTERDNEFDIPCPNCIKIERSKEKELEKLWEERSSFTPIRKFLDFLKENPDMIENYGNELDTSGFETLGVRTIVEFCDDGESRDVEVAIRMSCSVCDATFRAEAGGTVD